MIGQLQISAAVYYVSHRSRITASGHPEPNPPLSSMRCVCPPTCQPAGLPLSRPPPPPPPPPPLLCCLLAWSGVGHLPCHHSNVSSLGFRHVHLQLRMWSGSPCAGGIPGLGDGVLVGHGSLPRSAWVRRVSVRSNGWPRVGACLRLALIGFLLCMSMCHRWWGV